MNKSARAFSNTLKFWAPMGIFFLSALFSSELQAQLNASFTISKEGGCKPLTVQFTNTTTGADPGVTYSWDFGNGNTSTLANPGATFIEEKVFTVKLTARQGTETSTFSKQITVYKAPSVDFLATPTRGCTPLEVAFTANATPGDGTINRYLWDFGDGETADGAAITVPKHTYTFAQQAPVTLTVTNIYGCYNAKSYSGLIDVFQSIKADFTLSSMRTCTVEEPVGFSNTSQAHSATTWLWEFGDGKTATDKSPKHVYDNEGKYLVSLTATSPEGCKSVKVSDTVRIGNVKLDFALPESICQNSRLQLNHGIQQPYNSIMWYVNGSWLYTGYAGSATYDAYNQGKFEVALEVDFGNCKVKRTKELIVNPVIKEKGFTKKKLNTCTVPAVYEFEDTTGIGVKWNWTVSPSSQVLGTEKTFRHEFNGSSGYAWIYMEATTDKGCTTKIQDSVHYGLDRVMIESSISPSFDAGTTCRDVSHTFRIYSEYLGENRIASCLWDFGDGNTSSLKSATHTYTTAGEYQVKASYVTVDGCTGTTYFPVKITVINRPKVWLEVDGGNTICGNTPTAIYVRSERPFSFSKLFFDKDGKEVNLYPAQNPHKFFDTGAYNATVYGFWGQHCKDTLKFDKIINVVPSINYPMPAINTCDGDRLTVEFKDSSKHVEKWKWSFGDGTSYEFAGTPAPVLHHYDKTGEYKAKLTTTTGNCSVTDSITVYVWKKQKPVLSFPTDKVCASAYSRYKLDNYERNPAHWVYTSNGSWGRYIGQYSDNSLPSFEGFPYLSQESVHQLAPGKNEFRLLLTSNYFGCNDTTNYVTLETRGPVSDFQDPRKEGYCLSERVVLADSSKAYPGVPVTKKIWTVYGVAQFEDLSNGFSYKFDKAVDGVISLELEDAEGCSSFANNKIRVFGPKSAFTASSENVALGTTVNFTNKTDYYPDYTTPNWILPDGKISKNYNESYTFNSEGEYFVKLYHELIAKGCSDTAIRKITARKVTARFTHSISYINNKGCPPAQVRFTSTASNANRYSWNFGDGATGGNQPGLTHTYSQPGIFQVWHYTWDENNNVDSSFDFIEIKGPYALISADKLSACNNLLVTLSAEVKNANKYTWDLGDGTISSSNDTRITHQYLTAGLYTPSLILEDGQGCKATSVLPEKIIVDSLSAGFQYSPLRICAGSEVGFTGQPASFSASRLNAGLAFKWSVENAQQGSDKDFSYLFIAPGDYQVQYEVTSLYGCNAVVNKQLKIEPSFNAEITGASAVCKGDTAGFIATAQGADISWRWVIPAQTSMTSAKTPSIKWNTPGSYAITLLADNGACTDSVVHQLIVNDLPSITIGPLNARVCLGDTLNLTVEGNGQHDWKPDAALVQMGNNLARVYPQSDSWFRVQSLSQVGCRSTDSIRVAVVKPFNLQVNKEAEACLGKPINLSASGADNYQWIPSMGLNNALVANPVANITVSTTYKVIGRDRFGCFEDSADIRLTIHPLPQVNAGPDVSVLGGGSVSLKATSNIPGVHWNWTPDTYLNCSDCATPVSSPLNDIVYVVKATTAQGCTSTDSVKITVLCSNESIFIPTGFTPNGDGLNDRFGILGSGVTTVVYFRITDRWGKTVFERRNAEFGNASSFWDGTYPNGLQAASGSYIYAVEVACSTGTTFRYSGSVELLR